MAWFAWDLADYDCFGHGGGLCCVGFGFEEYGLLRFGEYGVIGFGGHGSSCGSIYLLLLRLIYIRSRMRGVFWW